eukprot:sb/3465146/
MSEKGTLEEENSSLLKSTTTLKEEIRAYEMEMVVAKKDLKNLQQKFKNFMSGTDDLKQDYDALSTELSQTKFELETAKERVKEGSETTARQERYISDLTEKIDEAGVKYKECQNQIHKLDDSIEELKRLNSILNEENSSLQLAHESAKKEIEMLEQEQEQATGDLQNLRTHLTATSKLLEAVKDNIVNRVIASYCQSIGLTQFSLLSRTVVRALASYDEKLIERYESEIVNFEEKVNSLTDSGKTTEEQLKQSQNALEELGTDLLSCTEFLDNTDKRTRALLTDPKVSLKAKCEILTSSLDKQCGEIGALEKDKAHAQKQMEDQEVMLVEQSETLQKLHEEQKIAQGLVERFQEKTAELEGNVGLLKESLAVKSAALASTEEVLAEYKVELVQANTSGSEMGKQNEQVLLVQ